MVFNLGNIKIKEVTVKGNSIEKETLNEMLTKTLQSGKTQGKTVGWMAKWF